MGLKKKASPEARFWPKVQKGADDECWNWIASTTKGYGAFYWRGRNRPAPRFSYFLHNGEIPDGLDVMHSCDNPLCVNPAHLSVGTRKQNMADMIERGRFIGYEKGGERNPNVRLSKEDVLKIREYLKEGYTQQSIADEFGVCQGHISDIKLGNTWANLK